MDRIIEQTIDKLIEDYGLDRDAVYRRGKMYWKTANILSLETFDGEKTRIGFLCRPSDGNTELPVVDRDTVLAIDVCENLIRIYK